MPATAAVSVTPTIVPAAPASTELRGPSDAGRAFDHHLESARQQRGNDTPATDTAPDNANAARSTSRDGHDDRQRAGAATDASASAADASASPVDPSVVVPPSSATATGTDAQFPLPDASASDDPPLPDAISVAGAMLALLGQAMPANASAAAGGAAKVMAASVLKAGALKGAQGQSGVGVAVADPAAALGTIADGGIAVDGNVAGNAAVGADAGNASPAAVALANLLAAGAPPGEALRKNSDGPGMKDLAALLGATPQSTPNSGIMPPHALHIASPAGSPAFAQELGQQVAWLGNQDIKQAKIRLHPEELGQLDVKVSVQHNGQVDVTFAAQHPAAVHALQQTLPQLDALLAQHGLSLGQAQVGQQSSGGGGSRNDTASFGGDSDAGSDEPQIAPVAVSALGMLDTFA